MIYTIMAQKFMLFTVMMMLRSTQVTCREILLDIISIGGRVLVILMRMAKRLY